MFNLTCLCLATWGQLFWAMLRHLSAISRDGDSANYLENRCQCSISLTVEKCFLILRQHILCFSLCPLPLVHLLSRLNSAGCLSLSSSERCSSALILAALPRGSGLCLTALYLSCAEEPTAGHSTLGVAFPVLRRGEGSPSSTCRENQLMITRGK